MTTSLQQNSDLVELGDLDALTRQVERLCAAGDWDGVLDLRDRCRRAFERGKQIWPAATYAEYRLALQAPAAWAAAMLEPGAGRFALGPLAEVVASTHTWAELAPYAPPGPLASVAAHERVVRGEDLTADGRVDPQVIELPLVLQPWEPSYPLAEYEPDRAHFPAPRVNRSRMQRASLGRATADARRTDPGTTQALLELVHAWTAESDGQAAAIAVTGDVTAALVGLGHREARPAEIDHRQALAAMAWAGASGGAHGRRRGMAPGRFAAWWALTALGGLVDQWPVPAEELGQVAEELRWYAWDTGGPDPGWSLRLAVEDRADQLAWAVAATDTAADAPQTAPSTRSR